MERKQLKRQHGCLVVFVVGASGDLATKKIYPSLLALYESKLLPVNTIIWGFARSNKSHNSFRSQLKLRLSKPNDTKKKDTIIDSFLSICFYQSGKSYGDLHAYQIMFEKVQVFEGRFSNMPVCNRLFYFAIPPNVFAETGVAVKKVGMSHRGWNRIIVEKPFGRDLQSCMQLSSILAANFRENQIYRIDHYLGKEMVQNMLVMRFGNAWMEHIWNRSVISSVLIEFKESIGTDGRGGYFDQYGIIRDIIQNHLLQILALITMERPTKLEGPAAEEAIRDSKVKILQSISPIEFENCILGQYDGYKFDPSLQNKNSNTATYAALCFYVNTSRWDGVPFILTAGKALNEQKVEIRIQFKDSSAVHNRLFDSKIEGNSLVIQLQPKESLSMGLNIKSPGFSSEPVATSLETNYDALFNMRQQNNPDAYTRLLLDALKGKHGSFVRNDELIRSWEIFTPLLHRIDKDNVRPFIYKKGSKGPKEAKDFIFDKCGRYVERDKRIDPCFRRYKSAL